MHSTLLRLRHPSRFLAAVILVVAVRAAGAASDLTVTVRPEVEKGAVNPLLFGVNAIYCNEPDAAWQTARPSIPDRLKTIATGIVRYPAGTVVTYYHWTNPTGQGWADSWDPQFNPQKNKPASDTMSLDEYLDFVKARGITPLVGINMGSGARFNRVDDGIAEAKALVQHCVDRHANVRYYYLDNEPYIRNANHPFTAEEYADQINRYAPALKAVDPGIKLIANLHPSPTHTDYTRTVVRRAGANIDLVDLHFYWRHGTATFANWTAEPHMLHQRTRPYSDQRAIYRKLFAEEGFPGIDVVSLEWNVGPHPAGTPPPTEAQVALMAAEQFIQFIQAGIPMSCFWPLHWESGNATRALLNSAKGYAPTKVYGMFEQFAPISGQMQIETQASGPSVEWLTSVAVKQRDGTTYVYLLNKNQEKEAVAVDVVIPRTAGTMVAALGFEASDSSPGPLAVHPMSVSTTNHAVSLTLPRNSLARLTISPARR